jgi:hypothetical protein
VIDTATNSTVKVVPIRNAGVLALHPSGASLYVVGGSTGISPVTVVSTSTNEALTTFQMVQCSTSCGPLMPSGMVIAEPQVSPAPSLSLTPDKVTYVTGDMFHLNLTFANPGLATSADVYFGVLLPAGAGPELACPRGDAVIFLVDGFMRLVTTCLSDSPSTFAPLAASVSLGGGISETVIPNFFAFTWPSSAPAGAYTFFIALTRPSTLDVIASAVTSVNFAP